jgi:peptidoglycan/LPS O-acetylase OafA/YrhL
MARFAHLPYIDGLRAVAVVAVLAFHLDRTLLSGGFVGVDVFFVISGYLITGILLAEGASDRLSVAGFFQRRIARILPLSLFVIVAVLCAASPFFTAVDFSTLGAAGASAALSLANIKYMMQGDYFEVLPDAQPLLHYWSLSVEEQFYLALPFVVAWTLGRGRRRLLVLVLATLLMSSLALCVFLTPINRAYAFYLLPTRAWELLAGGLLAAVRSPTLAPDVRLRAAHCQVLATIGAGLLAVCMAITSEGDDFPGFIAIVPVAATVMLIVACECDSWIRRLLCRTELQAVGRVSYSLYLWHWPTYCIVDYAMRDAGVASRTACKLLLTAALSAASYSLIERPSRRWLSDPSRRKLAFLLAGIAIVAVASVGVVVRRSTFVTSPISELPNGGVVFGAEGGKMKVALAGDSKGGVFSESLIELSRELDFQLNVLSFSAVNPLPHSDLYVQLCAQIAHLRPDVVIFSAGWSSHATQLPLEQIGPQIVADLSGATGGIIFVGEPPLLPTTDFRATIRSTGQTLVREQTDDRLRRRTANDSLAGCRSSRVWYLDPDPFVINADGLIMLEDEDRRLIFQDRIHLSMVGAARLKPALRDLLERAQANRTSVR